MSCSEFILHSSNFQDSSTIWQYYGQNRIDNKQDSEIFEGKFGGRVEKQR